MQNGASRHLRYNIKLAVQAGRQEKKATKSKKFKKPQLNKSSMFYVRQMCSVSKLRSREKLTTDNVYQTFADQVCRMPRNIGTLVWQHPPNIVTWIKIIVPTSQVQ